MRIAIDLDGVIFNTDMFFMAMAEIFDCKVLCKNSLINTEEAIYQKKYNWTKEEVDEYVHRYACVSEFDIMPCAKMVIDEIRKNKNNLVYFVSARGQFSDEEIVIARNKLCENGIYADGYFWNYSEKDEFCKKENIDIMIDDNFNVLVSLENTDVVCLYFRMAGKKELPKRRNLYEVHHWGDVYRLFYEMNIFDCSN